MKWWEKTVEYAYVRKTCIPVVPLAGTQETAISDAIAGWKGFGFIIEFKKDMSAFKREEDKYENMAAARRYFLEEQRGPKNLPHVFVFGQETNGYLGLWACDYWHEGPAPFQLGDAHLDLTLLKRYGMETENLLAYITELADFRTTAEGTSGGSVLLYDEGSECFGLVDLNEVLLALSPDPDLTEGYPTAGLKR